MSTLTYPPGPKTWHPLGQVFAFKNDLIGLLMNTTRRYGDIAYINMAGRPLILINDPDLIKDVTVTDHRNFIKSRALRLMKRLLGNGLITSEGEFHRDQQKMMQPSFRRDRIEAYARVMIEDTVRCRDSWRADQTYDIYQEMTKLSLGIATKTLFHSDVDGEAQELGECLTVAMKLFERSANPMAEVLEKLPLPSNIAFRKAKRRLDATVRRMIDERRADGHDRGDLLSTIIAAQSDETGAYMTDQQVLDEVITLFVGGHETTALSLTWTWYLLSQNPEAADRMYHEIDHVLKGNPPRPLDLMNLDFTRRVFAEALRLYPPIYILAREALEDYPLREYTAHKGTAVVFSPYVMHRNPKYWDDPERFDPDRFTPEQEASRPKFAYIPFGAGPRGCIGEHFARMEGTMALAIIAQRWRLEHEPGHRVALEPLLSLRPKYGMKMIARERPAHVAPKHHEAADSFPAATA